MTSILIIDDNAADAYLYLLTLKVMASDYYFYKVLKPDGVDFSKWDGFIIDYNQPREDGISMAIRIREANPTAKIVMITGGATEPVQAKMPPPDNVYVIGKDAAIADGYKIIKALSL